MDNRFFPSLFASQVAQCLHIYLLRYFILHHHNRCHSSIPGYYCEGKEEVEKLFFQPRIYTVYYSVNDVDK